ncbi:MAG TPA: glycosyltransferase [Candidatus Paceibacterota bacterium]
MKDILQNGTQKGSTGKIPCTVAVLTHNSDATLKAALESVKDFAEIIVCDGASTDRTLDIARAYGARILPQDPVFKDQEGKIKDFAGVHNQALQASSFDWHFYLDSDELMTPALTDEIHSSILKNIGMKSGEQESKSEVYWVDRKYTIDGKVVECAATYPTRQMRFFHKNAVTEFIKPIHERINPKPDAVIKTTKNFMLVPVSPDPLVWREKWKHYIELEVRRRGKISLWQWLAVCFENLKVSLLYAIRYKMILLFCHGKTRMSWRLEWERHVYHWNLCRALFKSI